MTIALACNTIDMELLLCDYSSILRHMLQRWWQALNCATPKSNSCPLFRVSKNLWRLQRVVLQATLKHHKRDQVITKKEIFLVELKSIKILRIPPPPPPHYHRRFIYQVMRLLFPVISGSVISVGWSLLITLLNFILVQNHVPEAEL